ncbi:ABC transporter ATP-binding protein [Chitinasiproducens palmae]|uniref:Sulfonate transport system ATP-binding protein n=1 Tax=Chitinasiproducens palmae TaxID=1770053 RepID=A0A1H2PS68_9BURK|nr:ABC transporter ATP-binding protein [Chitinasiproducens palmae]SDV48987.1 sulfonate transport system ATP-binding protein [Chitinasiproducens palmae]
MTEAALLDVRIDEKRYGDRTVLGRLRFTMQAGEIVSLVGPSGCGKTTLLRILAGLDADYRGSIRLEGTRLDGPSSRVGVVFQEPRLLPWLRVTDNVSFPLRTSGVRGATATRVASLLDEVGLPGIGDALPRTLSGGMAQRVAIARGLFANPPFLLLDEPFSAVDAMTRLKLQALLLRVARAHRSAAILVTHDLDEALYLSDRILLMATAAPDDQIGSSGRVAGIEARTQASAVGGCIAQEWRLPAHPRDRYDASLAPIREALLAGLGPAFVV